MGARQTASMNIFLRFRFISLAFAASLLVTLGACGEGLTTHDSGLKYKVLTEGTGPAPREGDLVFVHYVGTLNDNGTEFDSSRKRGKPFSFPLGRGQVIKGWDIGVAEMKKGGKRILVIPPQLGYGARGAGQVIPPNATLRFEVELLDIKAPPTPWSTEGKSVKSGPKGLKYIVYEDGKGARPKKGQTVSVHYSGFLESGKMFDSSVIRGAPIQIPIGVGRVIKGWDLGIPLMKVGAKYKLIIPAKLGYGDRPAGAIPPGSTLHFDVELVSVP